MDLCNHFCVSVLGQTDVSCGKNRHHITGKAFSQIFAYLPRTVGLDHFIPLSVSLILAEDCRLSRKQNPFASFPHRLFK